MDFKIEKKLKNSLGRAGVLETPHGDNTYSGFCGCGHQGYCEISDPEQVCGVGAEVVLGKYVSSVFTAGR